MTPAVSYREPIVPSQVRTCTSLPGHRVSWWRLHLGFACIVVTTVNIIAPSPPLAQRLLRTIDGGPNLLFNIPYSADQRAHMETSTSVHLQLPPTIAQSMEGDFTRRCKHNAAQIR
ncbi:hypothetical protein BV20DRAFT_795023 [Pilatotrama ljubarskyi]|nr:hypothetical protein BV20DRAFT_795023 [Pilatotrama ljubarskyi]